MPRLIDAWQPHPAPDLDRIDEAIRKARALQDSPQWNAALDTQLELRSATPCKHYPSDVVTTVPRPFCAGCGAWLDVPSTLPAYRPAAKPAA